MKDGFIRVAAATPEIQVADCGFNRKKIEEMMREACRQHVRMMVFPELCMTGVYLWRSVPSGTAPQRMCPGAWGACGSIPGNGHADGHRYAPRCPGKTV